MSFGAGESVSVDIKNQTINLRNKTHNQLEINVTKQAKQPNLGSLLMIFFFFTFLMYRVFQKSVPEPSSLGAAYYSEVSIYPNIIFLLCLDLISNINICKYILIKTYSFFAPYYLSYNLTFNFKVMCMFLLKIAEV